MHANRAYRAGQAAAEKQLGISDTLHPVQPPAPWTQGVDPRLKVRTGSALEKKAFQGQDKLPGGPADHKKPSDFDARQLRKGQKHEMEHTSDPEVAREIASDHLAETPRYYEKLLKAEKSWGKNK